jgi:hypothetical protein
MRDQVEVEKMAIQYSSIMIDADDEMAQGIQKALRWVLYPNVGDETLLGDRKA